MVNRIVLLLFICVFSRSLSIGTVIASLNVRYENSWDKENCWKNRLPFIENFLIIHDFDIICLQEVLYTQYLDLCSFLDGYSSIGGGRIDGGEKGEFVPVFFNNSIFEKIQEGTFWLSPTPNIIGSVGWDAAQPRIVSWVKLKEKRNGNEITILNTHLDDIGKQSRINSIELIKKMIPIYGGDSNIMLVGDFNETEKGEVYNEIVRDIFIDTSKVCNEHRGVDYTFHAFGQIPVGQRSKLDYIFANRYKNIEYVEIVEEHATNGVFLSDHNPIIINISW